MELTHQLKKDLLKKDIKENELLQEKDAVLKELEQHKVAS